MRRLQKIDIARGIALIGMVIYHCSWDLSFFGYISDQIPQSGVLLLLARSVAAAFLFLAGFSLFLAQNAGFRPKAFFRRFTVILLCAALVSSTTWVFMPQDFIYFGILHAVACAALVGLLFLHTPLWLNCAVIALCFSLPHIGLDLPYPALWWLGLSRAAAPSFDYVPFFPWFAWALAGQSLAAFMARRARLHILQDGIRPITLSRFLQFLGRHSLVIYLVHQPLLIAALYGFSCLVLPSYNFARAALQQDCVESCLLQNTEQICRDFCNCSLNALADKSLPGTYINGQINIDDEAVAVIRAGCAAQLSASPPAGKK
ncbi:MAG: DUF1624 domain-containing protein [Candidatus Tokpelaia sp.]|nr:MAG: DUF1624 domain-containing protein [Candidatus Tokpelaia sp.]KAA6207563.1 MAG: DUF1624 domain-containing protein [Candidatus Tokpelaia sp.]